MTDPYRDENEALRAALEAEKNKVKELENKLKPPKKEKVARKLPSLKKIFLTPLFNHHDDVARGILYTVLIATVLTFFLPVFESKADRTACETLCSTNNAWMEEIETISSNRLLCSCSTLEHYKEIRKVIKDPTE